MKWIDGIHTFPKHIKQFILFFVLALTFGYFVGFKFIIRTTDLSPSGLEENYIGNEANEEAEILKFKKAEGELITTIHTHILSFSLIFFALGSILLTIPMSSLLFKKILLLEPFISIIVTFGGVWLLWLGYSWLKYIVMISGMLITLTFVLQIIMIIRGIVRGK